MQYSVGYALQVSADTADGVFGVAELTACAGQMPSLRRRFDTFDTEDKPDDPHKLF